jgi:hypothetical protein
VRLGLGVSDALKIEWQVIERCTWSSECSREVAGKSTYKETLGGKVDGTGVRKVAGAGCDSDVARPDLLIFLVRCGVICLFACRHDPSVRVKEHPNEGPVHRFELHHRASATTRFEISCQPPRHT